MNVKKLFVILQCFVFLSPFAANAQHDLKELNSRTRVAASFEENLGQVRDQNMLSRPDVLYSGKSGDLTYHIRNNGISYNLNKVTSFEETKFSTDFLVSKTKTIESYKKENYRVDLNWVGSNTNTKIIKGKALSGYTHYYNVPNGSKPALYVKNYESILIKNLWEGVDLKYYSKDGVLESDWVMKRAEDYKKINFEVKGAQISIAKDGYLVLKTPFGEIREGTLKVFQNNELLKARWVINNNIVGFEVEDFNPMLSMTIDPPTLAFATYYGGSGNERGLGVISDNLGNIYLAGETPATLNIATTGSHQTTYGGGGLDAFVVKFNSNGTRQWATYYGGSGSEFFYHIALDNQKNVYATGGSNSSSNIATTGAFKTTLGGSDDGILVKFDANGVRQWGTYIGGTLSDWGLSVSIFKNNLYLTGVTNSNAQIATMGALQTTYGGTQDGFAMKFDLNGNRSWGTYIGGSGSEALWRSAVDKFGNLYLTGQTMSSTGISSQGSFQQNYSGSSWNAFLIKLDSVGQRQWGTYYGSGSVGFGCAIFDNDLYMSGYTNSSSGISSNGHQNTYGGGSDDAILVKFDLNGNRKWATYYGGTGTEVSQYCATDSTGNIWLLGFTTSSSGISTSGALQTTNGGGEDAFIVQLDSSGNRLYGTYFGGTGNEKVFSAAVGNKNEIHITGITSSTSKIATLGAHQTSIGGGVDSYLAKILTTCEVPNIVIHPVNKTATINSTTSFSVVATGSNLFYQWQVNKDSVFINLNDSGQYSGVNTDTLFISNISMDNNNHTFRCIVSSGDCDTISKEGLLTVDNTSNTNKFSVTSSIKLYPNPVEDYAIFEISKDLIGKKYSITDVQGRVISNQIISDELLNIDLRGYSSGVYFLVIQEMNIAIRFIKA